MCENVQFQGNATLEIQGVFPMHYTVQMSACLLYFNMEQTLTHGSEVNLIGETKE